MTTKIRDILSEHFQSFGIKSMSNANFKKHIDDFVEKIDNNEIQESSPVSIKLHSVKITELLSSLKLGKACGPDGLPNEFLKYGGNAIVDTLVKLFTLITDIEVVPNEWHEGIIKPLLKCGSCYDLDNYRGITLTSNVYKLYCKVIEDNLMEHIESQNVLGEEQGAFRKDRRTEDNLFTLQGLCSIQKSNKKKTYLAFLDLSKAFDRVWRSGLFYLLWENGIQGKCWRMLRALYSSVSNKVLFGNIETEPFEQDVGLKQGCVLSPTLFSVLMNDLSKMFETQGFGVEISGSFIKSLLFADDVVLIAKSEDELQAMLDIADEFATNGICVLIIENRRYRSWVKELTRINHGV